jgi:hypothetical protein
VGRPAQHAPVGPDHKGGGAGGALVEGEDGGDAGAPVTGRLGEG